MTTSQSIIVRKVSIKGNNRTKLSFFDNEINDTLNVSSIDQLSKSLDILHNNLVSKGLFDSIDINVEEVKKNSDNSDSIPIEINIKVTEKGIPFLKMESFVKQQNGSSNVGCEIQGNILYIINIELLE
jgi:outer membrane protein assembly factor BamA